MLTKDHCKGHSKESSESNDLPDVIIMVATCFFKVYEAVEWHALIHLHNSWRREYISDTYPMLA